MAMMFCVLFAPFGFGLMLALIVNHYMGRCALCLRTYEDEDAIPTMEGAALRQQIATLTKERDDWEARYIAASDGFQAARDTSYLERAEDAEAKVAVLTRERDDAREEAKRVWAAGTDEYVVGHWRGIAERLAESRDELKHKARGLEKQVATLTEQLADDDLAFNHSSDVVLKQQTEIVALNEQVATLTDNRDAWVLLATQAQEQVARLTAGFEE